MTTFLEVAITAARQAGAIVREGYGQAVTITHKGAIDLVTETDKRSEAAILAVLRGAGLFVGGGRATGWFLGAEAQPVGCGGGRADCPRGGWTGDHLQWRRRFSGEGFDCGVKRRVA